MDVKDQHSAAKTALARRKLCEHVFVTLMSLYRVSSPKTNALTQSYRQTCEKF